MEVNGIAHIFLTASNFERSREFYRKLLPFLGLKPVIDTETDLLLRRRPHRGRRSARRRPNMRVPPSSKTASACTISASAPASAPTSTNCTTFLGTLGTKIIRAPREDQWAPGYYSLLFEDPDGIRLELNHVPGKGLLG